MTSAPVPAPTPADHAATSSEDSPPDSKSGASLSTGTGTTGASTGSTISPDLSLRTALAKQPKPWVEGRMVSYGPGQSPSSESQTLSVTVPTTPDSEPMNSMSRDSIPLTSIEMEARRVENEPFINLSDHESSQLTQAGEARMLVETKKGERRDLVGGEKEVIGKGERVKVEFLLLSGKRESWYFGDLTTIKEVREYIWKSWPEAWREGEQDYPASPDALRLLYLGAFLKDDTTLQSHGAKPGTSTIFHLTVRQLLREEDDILKPEKDAGCAKCCQIC